MIRATLHINHKQAANVYVTFFKCSSISYIIKNQLYPCKKSLNWKNKEILNTEFISECVCVCGFCYVLFDSLREWQKIDQKLVKSHQYEWHRQGCVSAGWPLFKQNLKPSKILGDLRNSFLRRKMIFINQLIWIRS